MLVASCYRLQDACRTILYSPKSCEEDMIHTSMLDSTNEMDNTKLIYKTAKLIRNSFETHLHEKTQSDFIEVSSSRYNVSSQLLVGQEEELQTEMRTRTVDQTALTISQNILYVCKTKKQVKYKPNETSSLFRTHWAQENPQVVELTLSVHHDTRNKKLIDLLHGQILCVSYNMWRWLSK